VPFLDLKRNVVGVLLPYDRDWKRDNKGRLYNDAHRVYYEAKAIINKILDAGARSHTDAPSQPADAAVRPSESSESDALQCTFWYSGCEGKGRCVRIKADLHRHDYIIWYTGWDEPSSHNHRSQPSLAPA
jgi:hypothetical protein